MWTRQDSDGTHLVTSKELFKVCLSQVESQVTDESGVGGLSGQGQIFTMNSRTAVGYDGRMRSNAVKCTVC